MKKSFGEWTDEDARAAIESIRATVPDIDSYCVRFIYVFLFDCFFVLGDKNRGVWGLTVQKKKKKKKKKNTSHKATICVSVMLHRTHRASLRLMGPRPNCWMVLTRRRWRLSRLAVSRDPRGASRFLRSRKPSQTLVKVECKMISLKMLKMLKMLPFVKSKNKIIPCHPPTSRNHWNANTVF
jgi:hypothetical protein